jgi:hypothetical protein
VGDGAGHEVEVVGGLVVDDFGKMVAELPETPV